jgi:hypothetical protein
MPSCVGGTGVHDHWYGDWRRTNPVSPSVSVAVTMTGSKKLSGVV